MNLFRILFLSVVLIMVGCTLKPTKIKEVHRNHYLALQTRALEPVRVTKDTVVFDVRTAFDYSVFHIKNSSFINWKDFYEKNKNSKFEIKQDKETQIRRLARLGVDPSSRVLVVDKGMSGHGNAAAMGWALIHLGVRDVQIAGIESFKKHFTQKVSEVRENKKYWKPIERSLVPFKKASEKLYIIDVGPSRQYKSTSPVASPQAKMINIPWQEFMNNKGRPNLQIKSQLRSVGIYPNQNIVLKSPTGKHSKSVAYLLLSLGYEKLYFFEEEYK